MLSACAAGTSRRITQLASENQIGLAVNDQLSTIAGLKNSRKFNRMRNEGACEESGEQNSKRSFWLHSLPSCLSICMIKQTQWNGIAHRLISSGRRMQMIAAVIGRQKLIGMLRIANYAVEINHSVEISAGANPPVYRLPIGFAQRTGMIVALTPHRA